MTSTPTDAFDATHRAIPDERSSCSSSTSAPDTAYVLNTCEAHNTHPLTSAAVVLRAFPPVAALPHVAASISAFLDSSVHRSLEDAVKRNDLHLLERLVAASHLPLPPTRRYPRFLSFHVRDAALVAAELGHLDALKLLHVIHPDAVCSYATFTKAAQHGQLEVLQWLVEHDDTADRDLRGVVRAAAYQNHVHVIKWIASTWPSMPLDQALTTAVTHGYDEMTQLLGDFVTASLSAYATNEAAGRGDLDLIKWLDARAPVPFTAEAIRKAARGGHLEVIEWLVAQRHVQPTAWTSLFAAASGHLHVVQWLYARFPGSDIERDMDEAARSGHLEIVQYLHVHHGGGSSSYNLIDGAAKGGHVDIVKYLHEHNIGHCAAAIDEAAGNGHVDVVEFLHEHHYGGCTTAAMDVAAANGHLDMVKWLHEHRTEGCTTSAMDQAATHGHIEIVMWLHENRNEGCTTAAMDGAASAGHLGVVQWLYENRNEGCTIEAIDGAVLNGRVDVIRWLFEHQSERAFTPVMAAAAARGDFDKLQFLSCLGDVESANLAHWSATTANLHWFYESLPEYFAVEHIRAMASAYARRDVLAWLDELDESVSVGV